MSSLIIKKSFIINSLFILSYFFCILSDLFHIGLLGSSTSYFFFLSVPVFFLLILNAKEFPSRNLFFLYFWFFIIIVFSLMGAFIYNNISLLAQIYIYVIIPILFLYFGYLTSPKYLFWFNGFLITLCFIFSISQFLFFNYGFSGPLGVFEFITVLMKKNQLGLGVEEIGARATGFFVNPNILGFFSGLALFFFLSINDFIKEKKIYLITFILLSLFCIMLSISRTSIVGLLCGYIFILFSSMNKMNKIDNVKMLFISFFIFVLSVFLMFKFSSDYYLERAFEIGDVANQGAQGSGNLSGRLDAWVTLIDYVVLNPFGTIVPPQLVLDDSPDSQFIYFLTQGGLLLLVPFFILLLSIFLIAIRSRSNYFIAACIFLLISCLTFVSFNSFVMSLFWLIVGMSFKTNYDRKR